ncbi:ABC-2 family transporter protein [Aquisphaera giovannonii]|uniref:ABC-2 family transporter protein n=1 Tax=Aquisphaera giovannonii TaxID=406548 RepID=A0A5B9W9J9_9BACT|nr:ABC transporter permease subunit [Aquisphaera giovannonii]QEH37117.1 ABC-2 family transporter protein [Aquisphaera giovannonii]
MKSITIALATAKETIRQPSFFVMAVIAGALLIATIFVPYFTFGEDIKMYKDTGLTTISFACMLLALLTASSTVAEEIEGKTAITLLSKPINRRQFIVGKFLGIELGVLALYVLLGTLFAGGLWYKYQYDLRETAGGTAETAKRIAQVMQVLPGLVLGFFEVTILTSISVAISTRLPMLVNLVVCILIFFLGHLSPVLVEVAKETQINELMSFMARLFSLILPSLEFYNAGPSISTGAVIPWYGYVLPALGYCVLYSGAALLFAFLLFEDRDLA